MKKTIALLMLLFMVSISCNRNEKQTQQTKESTQSLQKEGKKKHKDCKDVHWGYGDNEEGPANWKNLCDGFSACGGKAQSPIDIETGKAVNSKDLKPIVFDYGKSTVDIINNGHTVQFNVSGDNKSTINGKDYKLLQFHYHTLSEHTVNGKHYPMEVHLVQKNNDKDYAVIGVMFKEGKENALLKKYLDKFPKKKGTYKSGESFDLNQLLPADKSYYHYKGSLTTPPCSEIVSWYVMKEPVEASKEQIEKFSEILHNNYRPVQPLNGRTIYKFEEKQ